MAYLESHLPKSTATAVFDLVGGRLGLMKDAVTELATGQPFACTGACTRTPPHTHHHHHYHQQLFFFDNNARPLPRLFATRSV